MTLKAIDYTSTTSLEVTGARRDAYRGCVVHTTDRPANGNSRAWLQGVSALHGSHASANILIKRDGIAEILVASGRYAFHAGATYFDGLAGYKGAANVLYYGVELENSDSLGEVPNVLQLRSLAGVLLIGAGKWSSPILQVYSHGQIATPMGRRNDPRGLDWGMLMWLMAHRQEELTFDRYTNLIGE